MPKREEVRFEFVEGAVEQLKEKLLQRLSVNDKGPGTFASMHECLGLLREEEKELAEAIHNNEYGGVLGDGIRDELLDVAVTVIFGLACLDAGTMDKL